jgi:hypothetical protein
MSLAQLSLPDLAGAILGFALTLMVFSYVFGDNALFRAAIYIFIGVASGYAAVVAWYNVIWPQLIIPVAFGSQSERLFAAFPLLLAALLLFKASPRFSSLGNPAIAYLLGVGAATAIGGAILGTAFPQALASMNLFAQETLTQGGNTIYQLTKGGFILVGTLATLAYFHFGARQYPNQPPGRPKWLEWTGWVGQVFIAMTFGVLFAGVYSAALTALIERVYFIRDFILALFAS